MGLVFSSWFGVTMLHCRTLNLRFCMQNDEKIGS